MMWCVTVWLLWPLFCVSLGGPVQHWKALGHEAGQTAQHGASRRAFYHQLPMFRHAPGPLVPRELFQPVLHKAPLPDGLTALLLPALEQQQSVQGAGPRGVQVWCEADKVLVRVRPLAWTVPSLYRLGSCSASRTDRSFLYFHYGLMECSGRSEVVGGQLVYTFILHYTPPPQGHIIRVPSLYLSIQCSYDRFHYSYKVGFSPQVQLTTFMKSIRSKRILSLTVCNGQWEPIDPGHQFILGEPVYFVAQSGPLLAGERLYVDSCYTSSSKDPHSSPRVDIIADHGCMKDSKRDGSGSRFLSGGGSVLTFSVDAFLFKKFDEVLYMHCSMFVGFTASHTSKSCTYNKLAGRWEELKASPKVCSCCDSMCTDINHSVQNTVSSVGWNTGQQRKGTPQIRAMSVQAEDGRGLADQEDEKEGPMGKHLKTLHNLLLKTEFSLEKDKENANPRTTSVIRVETPERTNSTADSQEGRTEREIEAAEMAMEEEDNQLEGFASDGIIVSEQFRQRTEAVQSWGGVPGFKDASASENSSIDASRDGSGDTTITPRSFIVSIDYNDHSSAENVSTAVIPIVCPNDDGMNCSTPTDAIKHERDDYSSGHDTMYTATSVKSFTPNNVGATSVTDGFGTVWDSNVQESSAGIHSATTDDSDSKSSVEEGELETFHWTEQHESDDKLASGSVNGKEPQEDNDVFHSPGLGSDQSSHPAEFRDPSCVDGMPCNVMLDTASGIEAGIHSSTTDDGNSGKSSVQADESETVHWSEDQVGFDKPVETESDEISDLASGNSKGRQKDDDDEFPSPQIRGLESDQSPHPAEFRDPNCVDGLPCGFYFDSEIEAGLHSATTDDSNSAKRVEVKEFELGFWSEPVESDNKLVDTRLSGFTSKGPHEDKDEFHSRMRRLESDRSPHPAGFRDPICGDGVLCESDYDSQIEEGEAPRASQFTEEVQEFSDAMASPHSVSPGSDGSERMQQDSRSAVSPVASTPQGSEGIHMFDRKWAKGFAMEQHREIEELLRQKILDDFF